jgi:hypothetical protein
MIKSQDHVLEILIKTGGVEVTDTTTDDHYESSFENPLWKLIKKRAREKDISYLTAAEEVVPEYAKTIRYRDAEYENSEVGKRAKEMTELARFEREKEQ